MPSRRFRSRVGLPQRLRAWRSGSRRSPSLSFARSSQAQSGSVACYRGDAMAGAVPTKSDTPARIPFEVRISWAERPSHTALARSNVLALRTPRRHKANALARLPTPQSRAAASHLNRPPPSRATASPISSSATTARNLLATPCGAGRGRRDRMAFHRAGEADAEWLPARACIMTPLSWSRRPARFGHPDVERWVFGAI